MKYQISNLLYVFLLLIAISASAQKNFNETANSFFESNVHDGKVDYDKIHEDQVSLNELVEQIGTYSAQSSTNDFAFYLNAYNILVIKQVIDNYPIDSPLSVDGFFDTKTFLLAGKKVTLNKIENEIIRPTYNDPRIHFALVCAAKDCPKLTNQAFNSDNVQHKLQVNTINALNDSNFIRYDGNEVEISKIFEWYKEDFGGTNESFLNFINEFRKTPIPMDTPVSFYEYDWSLNKK